MFKELALASTDAPCWVRTNDLRVKLINVISFVLQKQHAALPTELRKQ
jgi:hypothetical protein